MLQLEICDQSVALASAWLLENDWQELMGEADAAEAQQQQGDEATATASNVTSSATSSATVTEATRGDIQEEPAQGSSVSQQDRTMVLSTEVHVADGNRQEQNVIVPYRYARRSGGGYQQFQEDFDSDDEDEAAENDEGDEDEDEDEDEDDMYYDSGDEETFRVTGVPPPLAERIKITKSKETELQAKADDFWVAFDGHVVVKSMIGGAFV